MMEERDEREAVTLPLSGVLFLVCGEVNGSHQGCERRRRWGEEGRAAKESDERAGPASNQA